MWTGAVCARTSLNLAKVNTSAFEKYFAIGNRLQFNFKFQKQVPQPDSTGLGSPGVYNFRRMNLSRKSRAAALLVHGMGGSPSWWNPLLPVLERAGLTAIPLRLPSLEAAGPETWRDEVLAHVGKTPVVLIGHSLGAAVCLEAARVKPVEDLVMLACPPFLPDFTPEPPPDTGLSATAIRRVERFLLAACDHAPQISTRSIHFVGLSDRWVPVVQARRLPFPMVVIPGAGHGLNRSIRLADQLLQHLRLWQNCPHK